MNTTRRTIVAAIMACASLLTHAQGYKCKQADGSTSYQDHACAAGTASSSAVPTGHAGNEATPQGLPPVTSLDTNCQGQAKQTLDSCMGRLAADQKRCQAATMAPTCLAQANGARGLPQDEACVEQAKSCLGEAIQGVQACYQRELPAACKQQIDAYRRNREH